MSGLIDPRSQSPGSPCPRDLGGVSYKVTARKSRLIVSHLETRREHLMLRNSLSRIVPLVLANVFGFCCWIGSAQLTRAEAPAAAVSSAIDPLDWPNWRGPEQNGISRETGLVEKFDLEGGDLLWSKPEFGTRSTPIVMRGKLYTLCRSEPETPREGEKVVCLDAATGKLIWENKFNVYLSDVPDTRVGWSCCVGDPTTGRIYAMGVCGYFQCLDGETGKTIWSH